MNHVDDAKLELSCEDEEKSFLYTNTNHDSHVFDNQDSSLLARHHGLKRLIWINLLLLFSFMATLAWILLHDPRPSDNRQADSAYSPILDEANMRRSQRLMDGSVIDSTHDIFRQLPSAEVDQAWNNITNLHSIWVSRSEILRMGKDPRAVAKYPVSFGLGPDAYAAEMDIFHKIHCLNYLRREIYFDHYYAEKYPDGKVSALHEAHTGHCLSMLLQHLMCDANTEIVTKGWIEGQIHPFPDFSVNRMCGAFETLKDWQNSRRVPNELFRPWRKPEEVKAKPVSNEFKRIFGYKDGDGNKGEGHGYHHD